MDIYDGLFYICVHYDEKYSLRNKRLENVVRFGEIQTVF